MKTVIISGASTGIGLACAERMAQIGWHVYAGVRKDADAERLAGLGHKNLEPVFLDVTNASHISAVGALFSDGLDGLVNNAGIALGGPIEAIPLDEYRRQFDVNFFGQIALTQALIPALRNRKGRIAIISSLGGKISQPFMSPYCASKHALEAWSDAMRQELAGFEINVSIVEPGAISTPIWEKGTDYAAEVKASLNAEKLARYGETVDMIGKLIKRQNESGIAPERVADVVEHALTAKRPRTRYPVGNDAKAGVLVRRVVSDRTMDRIMRRAIRYRSSRA